MKLSDAITRAKERARTLREYAKPFAEAKVGKATKKYIERCLERAEYNEQVAAWLTELQERRKADRWVSVKERIPTKTGRYLVTYSNGEVDACFYSYEFISGKYEVTRWKPLPKPYESEAENLDYQRAVEDTEYCERHEPTYNSDDGSM